MSTYATAAFISAYRIRVILSAFRHHHSGLLPYCGHTALSLSQQFRYL
nr:MAG TPA: Type I polyketide synthase PikAIV/beta hydrolase, thioesterase, hydrolase [Caudoviricetes sp.]